MIQWLKNFHEDESGMTALEMVMALLVSAIVLGLLKVIFMPLFPKLKKILEDMLNWGT